MIFLAATNTGKVRDNNEDAVLVLPELDFAVVADGMGGHRAGEVASKMAVEQLEKRLAGQKKKDAAWLRRVFAEVNREVYAASRASEELSGMGTTLTCAIAFDTRLLIGHAGDSCAYLINGGIKKLTCDHTYVQHMLDEGVITEEMAKNHPQRHMLVNCVGYSPEFYSDTFEYPWRRGDVLLLCTDGLTDQLSEEEIFAVVSGSDMSFAAQMLINNALKRGGTDNISVALVKNGVAV